MELFLFEARSVIIMTIMTMIVIIMIMIMVMIMIVTWSWWSWRSWSWWWSLSWWSRWSWCDDHEDHDDELPWNPALGHKTGQKKKRLLWKRTKQVPVPSNTYVHRSTSTQGNGVWPRRCRLARPSLRPSLVPLPRPDGRGSSRGKNTRRRMRKRRRLATLKKLPSPSMASLLLMLVPSTHWCLVEMTKIDKHFRRTLLNLLSSSHSRGVLFFFLPIFALLVLLPPIYRGTY